VTIRRCHCDRQLAVVPSMLLIRVRVLPHGVLRGVASHVECNADVDVKRDQPARMSPRVNGLARSFVGGRLGGPERMRACVVAHDIRLERERNRPGALVALSAHQEHQRTGDVSARVDVLRGAAARSRMPRKSLAGRYCADLPAPRWRGSMRLTMWSNRRRARVALCAVASSGLRPSRVLQIGCDSNQPFRSGCFLLMA
jgi:hypothetical protein